MMDSQIWFKGKRVLRTAVQVLVGAAATLAVVVVLAPQVIAAVADVLPAGWVAWLSGAVAFLAAVSAAAARVMAIPAVDGWLKNIGLGSTPKAETGDIDVTTFDEPKHLATSGNG